MMQEKGLMYKKKVEALREEKKNSETVGCSFMP